MSAAIGVFLVVGGFAWMVARVLRGGLIEWCVAVAAIGAGMALVSK